jgi:3'-phosphoadenosine 5'-phosphosulfate sulfotransferase (PAPS reductase)/FAD synthetase
VKHIVGFSGGIDSQAALAWALQHHDPADVIAVNTQAGGNEHPLTVAHVRLLSETVHHVEVITPLIRDIWYGPGRGVVESLLPRANDELTFVELARWKHRFPSRRAQFCTEFLKLRPIRRWIGENVTDEFERVSGIRNDESGPRSLRQEREWDDFYDCELHNPVIAWTKQECFDFVESAGQPVNPLYKLGFTRVGCAPCINSSKADILNWALRFPAMIDKIRRWESEVGRTFFPPTVPGLVMNSVDEVVSWAKTSHGGRQSVFPILQERASCESKFGLCE